MSDWENPFFGAVISISVRIYQRKGHDLMLSCCEKENVAKYQDEFTKDGYIEISFMELYLTYRGKITFHPLWVDKKQSYVINFKLGSWNFERHFKAQLPEVHSMSRAVIGVVKKERSRFPGSLPRKVLSTNRLELQFTDTTAGDVSRRIQAQDKEAAVHPSWERTLRSPQPKGKFEESKTVKYQKAGGNVEVPGNVQVHEVGPKGGTFHVYGYEINFPQDALVRPTNVKMCVSSPEHINMLLPSEAGFCIALPFYCDLGNEKLKHPVSVKIPVWCIPLSALSIPVLGQTKPGNQWQYIDMVHVSQSKYVTVSTTYCQIVPTIPYAVGMGFFLKSCLCKNKGKGFTSFHYLSSEALENHLRSIWKEMGLTMIANFPIKTSKVTYGEVLPVHLHSLDPEYKFEHGNEIFLFIDDEFLRNKYFQSFSFNPPDPSVESSSFILRLEVGQESIKGSYHRKKVSSEEMSSTVEKALRKLKERGVITVKHTALQEDEMLQIADHLNKMGKAFILNKFRMRNCGLTPSHVKKLLQTMDPVRKVVSLDLSGNDGLDRASLESIIHAMDPDSVDLSDCLLNEEELEIFTSTKVPQVSLNYRAFSATSFQCPAIQALSASLKNGLKKLQLVDAGLTILHLEQIAHNLKELIDLKYLDLSCNYLTADGMNALATIVNKTGRLMSLHLSNCGLKDDCLEEFKESISVKVSTLDLSNNEKINWGRSTVTDIVSKCCTGTLDLTGCKIGRGPVDIMSRQDVKIETLILSDNPLTGTSVGKLAKNWRLDNFELVECGLSTRDIKEFREQLGSHKLKTISLGFSTESPADEKVEAIISLSDCVEDQLTVCWRSLSDKQKRELGKNSKIHWDC